MEKNNEIIKTQNIAIDGMMAGDTFDGLGSVSAGGGSRLLVDYPEPYKSQILDLLFKPNFGASLHHLKIEVGGDINSTFGTEPSPMRTRAEYERAVEAIGSADPHAEQYADVKAMFCRGYEFWLAAQAKKRNPDIILDCLQWGAPGWVKRILSQDNADYLAMFIKGAKVYWDIDISLVAGMQNEIDIVEPGYIKMLRKTLDDNGLPHVRIALVDFAYIHGDSGVAFNKLLLGDESLQRTLYAYGNHYSGNTKPDVYRELTEKLRENGLKIWNGEDTVQGVMDLYIRAKDDQYLYGIKNAQIFNNNYVTYRQTMSQYCFPVSSWLRAIDNLYYGDGFVNALYPWSGHYEASPTCWAAAHTTQFAQPGWKYLKVADGGGSGKLAHGGSYVTLIDPASGDYSVIIETADARVEQTLSFVLTGGLKAGDRYIWETYGENDSTWFINTNRLEAQSGNLFTMTVKPGQIMTITTISNGCKGAFPGIPKKRPFPREYYEDFESYDDGAKPRYMSDLFGAFKVVTDADKNHGKCLEQEITGEMGPLIAWAAEGNWDDGTSYSVIGDFDYASYSLTVDARMPESAKDTDFVAIGGHMDANVFHVYMGIHFRVQRNGEWAIYNEKDAYAFDYEVKGFGPYKGGDDFHVAGKLSGFNGTNWNTYSIVFGDKTVTAYVNGTPVCDAIEIGSASGGAFISSSRINARFDNLSIKPLP